MLLIFWFKDLKSSNTEAMTLRVFFPRWRQEPLVKAVGRIAELSTKAEGVEGTAGIGHTRWATHGKPTEDNAHPHRSETERFVLVHNGVIENYLEIKEEYLAWSPFQGANRYRNRRPLDRKICWKKMACLRSKPSKSPSHHPWGLCFALMDAEDPEAPSMWQK